MKRGEARRGESIETCFSDMTPIKIHEPHRRRAITLIMGIDRDSSWVLHAPPRHCPMRIYENAYFYQTESRGEGEGEGEGFSATEHRRSEELCVYYLARA